MQLTKEQYDWLDSVLRPLEWRERCTPERVPLLHGEKALYALGYNLDVERDGRAMLWGTYGCNCGTNLCAHEKEAKYKARKHQITEIATVIDLDKAMALKS